MVIQIQTAQKEIYWKVILPSNPAQQDSVPLPWASEDTSDVSFLYILPGMISSAYPSVCVCLYVCVYAQASSPSFDFLFLT